MSSISPHVSIIMPCYNSKWTLGAAIGSVRSQTMTDWELIIIDDGSDDGSFEFAKKFEEYDDRILVSRQKNSGPSAARNRGVELARSETFAFLDSDDIWEETHLALNLDNLSSQHQPGVSFSTCIMIDEEGHLTGEKSSLASPFITKSALLASNPTTTCSTLVFTREAFEAAGPMRTDMHHAEDQEWLFRILQAGYEISSTNARTVRYRTSKGGLSSDIQKMADGWEEFIAHARKLDPVTVEKTYKTAKTSISLYHARQAIRSGQPTGTSWKYLRKAFLEGQLSSLKQVRQAALLSLATLSPDLLTAVQKAKA